ncbi:MAG: hypothetical protein E7451_05250 [Ruminococcaceae bacterium]|nr:hypothetical protein [Oscillospiraceae bacterium]
MVKTERTPTPPASLGVEKKKVSGKYNLEDVVTQLHADFNGKCYLCGQDELQSIEVEHLIPHHGDVDLKFDWNNLFYSCAHCNSVKNQAKYESNVVDCCLTDPEAVIHQTLVDGHVVVTPLLRTPEAENTADLVHDCFELSNRPIRKLESQNKVKALMRTMNVLFKNLERFEQGSGKRVLPALRGMLDRRYKFAGFTRTYVRDHLDRYPDLEPYVKLDTK